MKNFFKLIGIIAIAAVIGFSIAACGDGSEDPDPKPNPDTGTPLKEPLKMQFTENTGWNQVGNEEWCRWHYFYQDATTDAIDKNKAYNLKCSFTSNVDIDALAFRFIVADPWEDISDYAEINVPAVPNGNKDPVNTIDKNTIFTGNIPFFPGKSASEVSPNKISLYVMIRNRDNNTNNSTAPILTFSQFSLVAVNKVAAGLDKWAVSGKNNTTVDINVTDTKRTFAETLSTTYQGKNNVFHIKPTYNASTYDHIIMEYDLSPYSGKKIGVEMSLDAWINKPARVAWQMLIAPKYPLVLGYVDSSYFLSANTWHTISGNTIVEVPASGDKTLYLSGMQIVGAEAYFANATLIITEDSGGGDTAVTLNSVTANGSASQTTTQLTLTFSQAIEGLNAANINLGSEISGLTKGTLSGSGPTYTLPVTGFTTGGNLSVDATKLGYNITGGPKTVTIYYKSGSSAGDETEKGSYNAYEGNPHNSLSSSVNYKVVDLTGESRTNVLKVTNPNDWAVALYELADYKDQNITINFSAQVKRVGAAGTLVWRVNNDDYPSVGTSINNAPAGTWHSMSGTWTGTPTDQYPKLYLDANENNSGTTTYYVYNFTITITVTSSGTVPSISTTSLPGGIVGTAYNQTLSATGTTPITWSLGSGSSLPAGLSLSPAGVISGTPTAAGTTNFTVIATNPKGPVSKQLSITIIIAPTITTVSLPNGTIGTAYSQTLTATGTTPITWTLDVGTLPAGLSLSSGVISGTPTAAGTTNFIVKAANAAGSVTKQLSIIITSDETEKGSYNAYEDNPYISLSSSVNYKVVDLTSESLNNVLKVTNPEDWAVALYDLLSYKDQNITITFSAQVKRVGAAGTLNWQINNDGEYPSVGTPIDNAVAGTWHSMSGTWTGIPSDENPKLYLSTYENNSDTTIYYIYNFTVTIATASIGTPPTITTASLPNWTTGTAYSQTLSATGDTPITWTLDSGALPTGLSLAGTTGVISGTPLAAGQFTFTVKATNAAGNNTKQFTVTITTAPTITTASLSNGTTGTAYNQTLTATGTTPITWSLDSGTLPTGLSLATSGVISGTPSAAGQFTFTVKATNTAGNNTKQFTVTIVAASSGNTFNNFNDFADWLAAQQANTADTAYTVTININGFGGDSNTSGSLGYIIKNINIYIILDLSGSTITGIEYNHLNACNNIVGIIIPSTVNSISDNAFDGCQNLTVINVNAGNTVYSSVNGVLYNKNQTILIRYPKAKTGSTFTIPSSVTSIGNNAFNGCTNLTGITIPNTVTGIGNYVFYGCTNLTSITIPNTVTGIGNYAFYGCTNLTSVTFNGTISSSNFSSTYAFLGDLRTKYLAGGTGTYTTTAPVNGSSVWTKSVSSIVEMVSIQAGTFTMGSPTTETGRSTNETQHSVTLSGFYMGKYQVTQEQYQAVMGSNPSNFKTALAGESGTPGKLPVEQVNWYNALVFCNKLSVMEGLNPAYKINGSTDPAVWGSVPASSNSTWNAVVIDAGSNGYRLPTEAQWEYACRAGTMTAYNTGDTIRGDTGWYSGNSSSNGINKTHQVGLKTANTWGLYDMHGNVLEWCWDWYGTYQSGSQTDPMGASSGTNRVRRGGSYNSTVASLRSACRSYGDPSERGPAVGFRVVRP